MSSFLVQNGFQRRRKKKKKKRGENEEGEEKMSPKGESLGCGEGEIQNWRERG